MSGLGAFRKFTGELKDQDWLMPVLFIGHGSPMNGIENNVFSNYWKQLAAEMPVPSAVLVISAHWMSRGTRITAMDFPRTIHDFGGFPEALFAVQYPAPGHPGLARQTASLLTSTEAILDHDWGLDHGSWTVVRHMYPEANIPVLQMSIDFTKGPQYHYDLAKELFALRKKGVLILGSGNLVHNLGMLAWDRMEEPGFGYDRAHQMNQTFKELMEKDQHEKLIHFQRLGKEAQLSIPTPEHYLPLLYILGLKGHQESPGFFNDQLVGGSLAMTSVRFG
ncbi:MAG: 4,5-DOPA-extradiol-dioxygenase [Flavisolibacter sp.]